MYRSSEAQVRCRQCDVELPAAAAAPVAEGHVCARCASALWATRGTVLPLAAGLAWPAVDAMIMAIEYAWVTWLGTPSLAVRIGMILAAQLLGMGVAVLAIRATTPRRPPRASRLSPAFLIAVVVLALASVASIAGSTWLSYAMTMRMATSSQRLADWSVQTQYVSLVQIGVHSAAVVALFLYALVRWQRATRRTG